MAVPTSRSEFKEWCLRKLGKGVIEINMSDEQAEDRIDESLNYWYDFHFSGSDKTFYKHQVTDTDKTNKYITLPENIRGAVRLFDIGSTGTGGGSNLFNARYQIALDDYHSLASSQLAPYVSAMMNIAVMEEILVGKQPIRYNRYRDQFHIDMDWDKIATGEYIIVEAYEIVDPDVYTDAWNDQWLQRYTTALMKIQWGENLKKYQGMQMPGGMTIDGMSIYNEGLRDKEQLEMEMMRTYNHFAFDMIG